MNTLLNKEWLLERLMNTVGYVESENKEEFLKGAGMIIDKVLQIATDETNYLYENWKKKDLLILRLDKILSHGLRY